VFEAGRIIEAGSFDELVKQNGHFGRIGAHAVHDQRVSAAAHRGTGRAAGRQSPGNACRRLTSGLVLAGARPRFHQWNFSTSRRVDGLAAADWRESAARAAPGFPDSGCTVNEIIGGATPQLDAAARRRLMSRFWQTARGFWSRTGDRRAWLLSGALVTILFVQLFVQYRMNAWNRDIFNALEQKDSPGVLYQAFLYLAADRR